jgi:hypothetical protein
VTPEGLRGRAEQFFDSQHPRRGLPTAGRNRVAELIAEIPFQPGQVLRVERIVGRGTRPSTFLSFRAWVVEPGGGRFPAKGGFTINCDALPNLAFAVAKALELELGALPAWAGPEPRR